MQLLNGCGTAYLKVSEGSETATLRDTNRGDTTAIQRCVAENAVILDRRFPGLTARYGNRKSARRAIARQATAPDMAGLTIGCEREVIGRASVMLGSVACTGRALIEDGANIALWLDGSKWGKGIGGAVLRSLVRHIQNSEQPVVAQAPIFTLVDADNERSHRMVASAGFATDGNVANYDSKGITYTDSVLYSYDTQ